MTSKKLKSTNSIEGADNEAGAGPEELTPLISEAEWESLFEQLSAHDPRAVVALRIFFSKLSDDLESGPEGAARATERLKSLIQMVEGMSTKYVC